MAGRQKLVAVRRDETGKGAARTARRAGRVPAVLYGKDQAAIGLAVDAKEAMRLVAHQGTHAILDIEIEGADAKDKNHTVLLKEVQRHSRKDSLVHLDFLKIDMTQELERTVAINTVGDPAGVKLGGVLTIGIHELTVRGIANKIPESIEVDITHLNPGDVMRVSDIAMPEGVIPATTSDEIVASCLSPRGKSTAVEGAEEAAAATPSEPEVIGQKSKE